MRLCRAESTDRRLIAGLLATFEVKRPKESPHIPSGPLRPTAAVVDIFLLAILAVIHGRTSEVSMIWGSIQWKGGGPDATSVLITGCSVLYTDTSLVDGGRPKTSFNAGRKITWPSAPHSREVSTFLTSSFAQVTGKETSLGWAVGMQLDTACLRRASAKFVSARRGAPGWRRRPSWPRVSTLPRMPRSYRSREPFLARLRLGVQHCLLPK